MPNGRTHDFITLVSGAAMAPALLNSDLPDMGAANATVLLGTYLASGLLFSPDLDVRSSAYRRWRGMRWVWLPYQRVVPHRSWVSHSFVFGPLLRALYFTGVLALIGGGLLALFNLLTPIDATGTLLAILRSINRWILEHPSTVAYALVGLVAGGAIHTLADLVFTAVKRRF